MDRLSPTEAIELGVSAHQAVWLEEALRLYRDALRPVPDDAEANSLCGLALSFLGRYKEAGLLLVKVVVLELEQAGYRAELAMRTLG